MTPEEGKSLEEAYLECVVCTEHPKMVFNRDGRYTLMEDGTVEFASWQDMAGVLD
jgi:hypothetical protein